MKLLSNILFALILCLPLSGCFPLGVAAGAGGAYVASKEFDKSQTKQIRAAEKQAVREARGEWERERNRAAAADARAAAIINARLLGGELTKVITIHTIVKNGVVTLFGNVPSNKIVERAIDVAKSAPGVREVRSQLLVIEMRIEPVNPNTVFPTYDPAQLNSMTNGDNQGYSPEPQQQQQEYIDEPRRPNAEAVPTDNVDEQELPQVQLERYRQNQPEVRPELLRSPPDESDE